MLKKLNNKKGFTLAELLVVVAIIGVLVAVSIPIFTAQLRKARVATDLANERSAKAAAVAAALTAGDTNGTYFYDAASGTVKPGKTDIKAYGKVSDANSNDGFAGANTDDHTGKIVKVVIGVKGGDGSDKDDNTVTITWEAAEQS